MSSFLLSKIGYSISILFGVYTILFILFNVLPVDVTTTNIGQSTDSTSIRAIRQYYHLDQSLFTRYLIDLNHLSPISIYSNEANAPFYLDTNEINAIKIVPMGQFGLFIKKPYLGRSYISQEDVWEKIKYRFFYTFVLALLSMIVATVIGIIAGIISAKYQGTFVDRIVTLITISGISAPSFFVAIIVALIFGFYLSDYTGLSFRGSLLEIDDYGNSYYQWKNLILPVLALGIRPIAIIAQLTKNSMLDVLKEDYIRSARAKGLSEKVVFLKHALINAMNPVITSISGWFASLLAGAYFIEFIFDYKGLGHLTVNALLKFDFPIVMGASLLIASIFLSILILVDFLYVLVDPRLKK
jgi:peptide/nickel transport system permease protein